MKISRNKMLYFLAFFFLIKPDYYSQISGFTSIYNPITLLVSAFILLSILRRRHLTKQMCYISLVVLFPVLVSILKGVPITTTLLLPVIHVLMISLLLQDGLQRDFDNCLSAFALILEILSYINFFTIIFYPNGLYDADFYSGHYWFFGYKNVMIRFLLPAVCVNAIWTVHKHKKYTIRLVAFLLMSCLTEWLVDSKTGAVGIGFIIVMMFFFTKKEMPKFINIKSVSITIGAISVALATTSLLNAFSSILVAMGEEVSVMSRQLVWSGAIKIIKASPIWGYGLRSPEGYRQLLNISTGWGNFSHPHNYILYALIQGGIIEIFFVGLLFFRTSQKCINNPENFAGKMLLLTYIAFFIMGITESLVGATLLYPIAMLTDYIIKNEIYYQDKLRV